MTQITPAKALFLPEMSKIKIMVVYDAYKNFVFIYNSISK